MHPPAWAMIFDRLSDDALTGTANRFFPPGG